MTTHLASRGQSTSEYGMILATIALVAIAALSGMGKNLSNTFSSGAQALQNSVANPSQTAANASDGIPLAGTSIGTYAAQGSGYYSVVRDPDSGNFKLLNTSPGDPVTALSVDGNQFNTYGSILLANQLSQLAAQETDPNAKTYYAQLAQLSYSLGNTEGIVDNLPSFTALLQQTPMLQSYTHSDASKDMGAFRNQLSTLINNPPPGISPEKLSAVLPYAADVNNIAISYQNQAGSVVQAPNATDPSQASFANIFTAEEIKTFGQQALANSPVQDTRVRTTFRDADTIDRQASGRAGSGDAPYAAP